MKEILDNIPKAIALLSFVILALTVVHEWGYFWLVGTHFQTVASAYDYLSNSILWLPQNLLMILAAFVVEMAFIGYFRRSSADEDKPELGIKAKNERYKKIIKRTIQLASGMCVLSVVVVLLTYFLAPPFLVLPYILSAGFFYVALFFFSVLLFQQYLKKSNRAIIMALLVLPSVLIFDFGIGLQEAHDDIRYFKEVYVLAFKRDRSADGQVADIVVQILRSFDKGLLVRDPKFERVIFVRWDSIASLTRPSYAEGSASNGCKRFPVICGQAPPEP